MNDILIITLGRSIDPIINCISSLQPVRVIFLCSAATQKFVEQIRDRVNLQDFDEEHDVIVLQKHIGARQGENAVDEIDQLDFIYTKILDLIQQVRQLNPGARIIADYAGGTKTMTAGLAMAAIDDGNALLNVTTSNRSEDQSSISGYSSPFAVATITIHTRRLRDKELPDLLKRYDYDAARLAVKRIQLLNNSDPESKDWLRRLEALLKALDAWDRFDHRTALDILQGLSERHLDQILLFPLKRVIGSRRLLDKDAERENWPRMSGHGLEAVEDLLRNAERRDTQKRYDDAVGRLYRAMELMVQLLLKIAVKAQVGPTGIDTGAVNLDRLPQDIQGRWRDLAAAKGGASLKIGLADAYDLLADLGHTTGLHWLEQRDLFIDVLKIRNHSLFAHGFKPIQYADWKRLSTVLGGFMDTAIQQHIGASGSALRLQQLPNSLEQLQPSP